MGSEFFKLKKDDEIPKKFNYHYHHNLFLG